MLKRMSIRKILVASLSLIVLGILYLIPSATSDKELDIPTEVEYNNGSVGTIYLIDSDDYVARTTISTCDCEASVKAKDLMEGLIIDGEKSNIIPNGFRSIIPSGTKVLGVSLEEGVLTINFSEEFMDVSEKYSEKMVEAIVYTLTSIEGINKKYELTSLNDIDSYTVYYVSSYNDNYYYVPITKYINNTMKEDKIKVIIDELANSPISKDGNLVSYLNVDTVLNSYEIDNDKIKLNFNDTILINSGSDKILEEVIYTISLSVNDMYGVKEVSFYVGDNDIYDFKF